MAPKRIVYLIGNLSSQADSFANLRRSKKSLVGSKRYPLYKPQFHIIWESWDAVYNVKHNVMICNAFSDLYSIEYSTKTQYLYFVFGLYVWEHHLVSLLLHCLLLFLYCFIFWSSTLPISACPVSTSFMNGDKSDVFSNNPGCQNEVNGLITI